LNNSRFSISIHILTLLARAEGELLSSDFMAGSININPVLVRKELIHLRKNKMVCSREGKNGGYWLTKAAADIRLADVYRTVHAGSLLGKSKNKPNPNCVVGRQMNIHLDNLYNDAEKALLGQLEKVTLKKFAHQFD
jgi:Rrf2 family protein